MEEGLLADDDGECGYMLDRPSSPARARGPLQLFPRPEEMTSILPRFKHSNFLHGSMNTGTSHRRAPTVAQALLTIAASGISCFV